MVLQPVNRAISLPAEGRKIKVEKDGGDGPAKAEILFIDETRGIGCEEIADPCASDGCRDREKDDKATDRDKEDLVEKVVNDLGLAYYFVLLEREAPAEVTQDIQTFDTESEDIALLEKIFFDAKNVEQLLSKYGVPSDVLDSLQAITDKSNRISLGDFIGLIKSLTDYTGNTQVQNPNVILGADINNLLKPANGDSVGFVIAVPDDKYLSLSEIRIILNDYLKKATSISSNTKILSETYYLKVEGTKSGNGKSTGSQDVLLSKIIPDSSKVPPGTHSLQARDAKSENVPDILLIEATLNNLKISSEKNSLQIKDCKPENGQINLLSKAILNDEKISSRAYFLQAKDNKLKNNSDILSSNYVNSPNNMIDNMMQRSNYLSDQIDETDIYSLRGRKNLQSASTALNLSNTSKVEISKITETFDSAMGNDAGTGGGGGGSESMWSFANFGFSAGTPGGVTAPGTQAISFSTLSYDSWVSQMADYLQRMVVEGRNRLVLQMSPPELGTIVIRLKAEGNRITTHISASNDSVKDMMQQSQHLLERYLQEQGLVLDGFTVDVHSEGMASGSEGKSNREIFSRPSGNSETELVERGFKKKVPSGRAWHGGSVYLFA